MASASAHKPAGKQPAVIGAPKVRNANPLSLEKEKRLLDIAFVGLLSVLGVVTRLYNLGHPGEVVFDEQHFGLFTNHYIKGEYFLDIHPPLAKFFLWIAAYIAGYQAEHPFSSQGEVYQTSFYLYLRFGPAFFGGLLVPLVYITCRVMKLSPAAAASAAWLVLCENIIITESRYILCDSYLFFFDVLSVMCSFQANNQVVLSKKWIMWMFFCGISMGCAASVKFTALGVVGAVGLHQIMVLFQKHDRPFGDFIKDFFARGFLLLAPLFSLALFLFVLHIWALPFHGEGDAFMTSEFLARLEWKPEQTVTKDYSRFQPLGLFSAIKELVRTMHASNIGLRATHPFSSTWDQWPLDQGKPVLYWHKLRQGAGMWIYCVGNPIVWWLALFLGMCGFAWLMLFGSSMIFSAALSPQKARRLAQAKQRTFSVATPSASSSSSSVAAEGEDDVPAVPAIVPKEIEVDAEPKFSILLFRSFSTHFWTGLMVWFGYLANLLPYCLIPRCTWNYHYIPSLLFGILVVAVVIEIILRAVEQYDATSYLITKLGFVVMLVSATCMWLYLSPWTYALPMTDAQHQERFLFDSWKFGS